MLTINVLQEVSKAKRRRKRYRRIQRTSGSFFIAIATIVLQCIIVNRTIASFISPRIISIRRQHTCIRFAAQLKEDKDTTIIIRQKLEHEINDDDSSSIEEEEEISPLLSSIATSDDNIDIDDDDHICIEESSIETAKHDDIAHNDEIIEENEQHSKLSPQTSSQTSTNKNINQQDDNDEESFNQYNVINNLESASKRLLNELEITSSTYTTKSQTSYSSLAKLSKAHHSMLSKSSNMRRQRFVTGKYPLYISVLQNPTNKWLGLASSQIYLNGTSIDKSLASTNIYNWLNNKERINLVDEYELLNIELLAEIYVKKPGYVNILPKGGAGRSILSSQEGNNDDEDKPFFWKSWKTRRREDDLIKSKLDELDNAEDDDATNKERLWVTGFSLTKSRGEMHTVDIESGKVSYVNDRTRKAILWPNEVTSIPKQVYPIQKLTNNTNQTNTMKDIEIEYEDALLVTDGFLVPGKDKGGLYVVKNPGNSISEEQICLTGEVQSQNWFYHRAIWMDITGDGRQSILAARAKFPLMKSNSNGSAQQQRQDEKGTSRSMGKGQGQLVWLERPQPHSFCANTGTPLDADGTIFDPFSVKNTPWKLRILDEGPDVMFSVSDLDPSDDTIEIIASQFFSKKLSLHSLKIGCDPRIVFRRTIDDRCGAAFSSLLADLDGLATTSSSGQQNLNQPTVVDSGSTVVSLQKGDAFSHLLVTSHECSYVDETDNTNTIENQSSSSAPSYGSSTTTNGQSKIDGGSLFGYRIPSGKDAWKTKPWQRSIIATGFKVDSQLNNMINPGAPGFCYTFFPTRDGGTKNNNKKWSRPLIGISGDCAESAYILRPIQESGQRSSSYIRDGGSIDKSTNYALMCEIKCKSTVGSLAIGYDDLHSEEAEQQSGYAKIYIPCYEQDKILVFSMGSGEEEYIIDEDDGW